jgi:hypothetical protein
MQVTLTKISCIGTLSEVSFIQDSEDNRRDWTTGEIRKSLECLGNAR